MCVVRVPKLALQSELFLHTRRHGTEFTVVHYSPDYLPLCGVTFLIKVLVQSVFLLTSVYLKERKTCGKNIFVKNIFLV